MSRRLATTGLLLAALAVAACETTEDKVERLYSEARELAVAGEPERARLVLKNLFHIDGYHRDARMLYAEQSLELDDQISAYRHYLLVAEQNPDFVEVRLTLSELAAEAGDWGEVERHIDSAAELDASGPVFEAMLLAMNYREAVRLDDAKGISDAQIKAEELLTADPTLPMANRVYIDAQIKQGKPYEAIDAANAALEHLPKDGEIHQIKLGLLSQTQQIDLLGEHLQELVVLFPEEEAYRTNLISWYVSTGDVDGAENFIRSLIDPTGEDRSAQFGLIQFLRQLKGNEAAVEELDRIIAETENPLPFERVKAAIYFDEGRRDEAIEGLETLIAANEADNDRRDLQVTLARMYLATGDIPKARELVDSVLSEDDKHVDALVMRAAWMIEADQVRDAILVLRTALDQSPQNLAAINTLVAAYERDGNRDLMGETLLLGARTSGFAPDQSLSYARFLVTREKLRSAEDVLLRSIRANPSNVRVLQALGEVYLLLSDWPRVEQVIAQLERVENNPEAKDIATGLQATLFTRMQRTDESISLLRNVIEEGRGGLAAHAAIVRAHLANGEVESARSYLDGLLSETDDIDTGLNFLNAALLAVEGEYDQARKIYRDILEETPESEIVWRALIATALREGGPAAQDEAAELVSEALSNLPGSPTLLWMQASMYQQANNFDRAIEIYEEMYDDDSSLTIVANNLASLLTTHRTDEESLERAVVISRRLRGTTLPAFQDTYGWIAYRLGNYQEAEDYLTRASNELPNEPLVQYHLAKTYAALGDYERAIEYFTIAVEQWGETTPLPQVADAQAELARLRTLPGEAATETVPQ